MAEDSIKFSPWQGKREIPEGLIYFSISSKSIVPYKSGIYPKNVDKKKREWLEEGLSFVQLNHLNRQDK